MKRRFSSRKKRRGERKKFKTGSLDIFSHKSNQKVRGERGEGIKKIDEKEREKISRAARATR